MPFKTFWSSDLSVFPQKRKMHFKYAHSAKLVEVLINKFIFSVVSNPPHWSWHTMSSCYWQQSNANKTINQSHMFCLLHTFCERIAHFDFNVKTLSKLQKVGFIPFVQCCPLLCLPFCECRLEMQQYTYCALTLLHMCCHRGEWIILFHSSLVINMQRRARPSPLCQVPFNITWMYKDFFITT